MVKVAVVYHSETGNTHSMAKLIGEGAGETGEVSLMSIDELDEAALEEAHAVVFGAPTYLGQMSWQMKKCLDTLPVSMAGKLGAAFASAGYFGGGSETTEVTIAKALLCRGMMVYSGGVGGGHPVTHFGAVSINEPEDSDAERCIKLGRAVATKAAELFG